MEQIFENKNGSTFREDMLGMSRMGRKFEAMTIIQSKIDVISCREVISKTARKKSNRLQNLLLEIKTGEALEIHSRSSNHVFDRPIQTDNGIGSEVNPINNNISAVLPSAAPPISNFLHCLKSYLDLVEKIGKEAVLTLLSQEIHNIKMNKANGYQQELNRHYRIINIISKEEQAGLSLKKRKKNKVPKTKPSRIIKPSRNTKPCTRSMTRQKEAQKRKQRIGEISNGEATVDLPNVPKIKSEPTNYVENAVENKIKIENIKKCPDQICIKQEVIEID